MSERRQNYLNVASYLQVLVGGFLVFLGHCLRGAASEHANDDKQSQTNANARQSPACHFPVLAWLRQFARPMGTKGDPVSCVRG